MGKKNRRHKKSKVRHGKRISEFRKERSKEGKGHARYLFKKLGKTFWGFKITHGDHVDGMKTIVLKQNPEPKPKDSRPAKILPKVEEFHESKLSPHRLEGWKFGEEDQQFVNGLIATEEKKE